MKPVTLVGVALIILGVLALAYQGITYTTREKVIDLGTLKASVDKEHSPASDRRRLGTCRRRGVGHRRNSKVVRVTVAVGDRLSRGTTSFVVQ